MFVIVLGTRWTLNIIIIIITRKNNSEARLISSYCVAMGSVSSPAQQLLSACDISLFSWFPSSREKLDGKKRFYSESKTMLEPVVT